jgi:hypothetical protein
MHGPMNIKRKLVRYWTMQLRWSVRRDCDGAGSLRLLQTGLTNLRFVSPCIIVQFKQITNQLQQFSSLLSWHYLQLNMFRTFSRPSSGAQWLQWQPLVLASYRGDSRAVFVVGPTETCWTVNKRQDNKLENCCIWLVIYVNSIYKFSSYFKQTLRLCS